MKRINKLFAVLLVLVLLFGMAPPMTAEAADSGDTSWYSESATSFAISSADELAGLAGLVNAGNDFSGATITLDAAVDLSSIECWTPIGSEADPFCGVFDGGGNTIEGMKIGTSVSPDSTYNFAGLFGFTGQDAVIKNVVMSSVSIYSIRSDTVIGGIVGKADTGGTIKNCSVTGNGNVISADVGSSFAGGIVGISFGDIVSCSSTANVVGGSSSDIGGIAGFSGGGSWPDIVNCNATGNVTGGYGGSRVGGLIGEMYSINIINCYATGDVTGYIAGGFAGYNGAGNIRNCFATGDVTTSGAISDYMGGFLGDSRGGYAGSKIINCFAAGAAPNGFAGYALGNTMTNCYWDTDLNASDGSGSSATGQTTTQMQSKAFIDSLNTKTVTFYNVVPDGVNVGKWIADSDSSNGGFPELDLVKSLDVTVSQGTTVGAVKITGDVASGDHLAIKIITPPVTFLPWTGDVVTGAADYNFGEDFSGIQRGDYLMLYELDSLSQLVGYKLLTDYPAVFLPVLSAEDVYRYTLTGAVVSFESDTAGTYYYTVVEDGADEPDIGTTGTGTTCYTDADEESNRITLYLTDAGAKDLYIVVKANGLVSSKLKIDIPAYVGVDVVISEHSAGSLETEINAYMASAGAIDGKIESLKVSGGQLNQDDQDYIYDGFWSYAHSTMKSLDLSETGFIDDSANENTFMDDLFDSFEALTSVTLPDSITVLPDEAFKDCSSLESLTLLTATPPSVGTDTFSGVSGDMVVYVPAGSVDDYLAADDGDTTDNLWYGFTVEETGTDNSGDDGSSGTGGGSGGSSSGSSLYYADAKGSTYKVTVDSNNGSAGVDVSSDDTIFSDGTTSVITMPSIPDVDTYMVGISVSRLSSTNEAGTLTFKTDAGSVTVPSNMLTGVSGISGSKAEISIGQGDKDSLPEDVQSAIGDRPLISLSLSIDDRQTDWNNPDSAVTVSIPYEPTFAELANPESIVIWYIDGAGNVVTIPNGHYDPITGTMSFATTHFSNYAVAFTKVSFNDVSDTAWYSGAVGFIAARGITTGSGNGIFSPVEKLSRGQFIVMLMKAYGMAPDEKSANNFIDAGNTYYTGYLAAAKRLGISAGIGNDLFAPKKEITRQEMFTLLYNALNVLGQLPEGDSGKTLSEFTDVEQINSWAKEAMTVLVGSGTIGGTGGKLNPTSITTRAEMAQVLYTLMSK